MKKKLIWTKLLLFGIAFSLIALNFSCGKTTEHFGRTLYYDYFNQSSYALTIVPYAYRIGESYHINPNDSMSIISHTGASVPLIFAVDSLFILLDDSIKVKYYASDTTSKSNILWLNNYTVPANRNDIFKYTFTDKDFEDKIKPVKKGN